ncbi:hypothetical protein NUH16_011106 [Penicillium rubens]|nr:hypothetical protein NUH16_011106 [Penicillium rubens]
MLNLQNHSQYNVYQSHHGYWGHARLWLFTSVSVRNGLVGPGLVVRINQVDIASSNRTLGSDDALNAHYEQLGWC